jgi:phosphatidylglycerophosphate synthase
MKENKASQSSSIRKLPRELENPIDSFLVDIADIIQPFFKYLEFTPNGITTLSLVLALYAAYKILKRELKLAAILLFIAYFFDGMDGNFARTYNMCSKFGDYYDHLSDLFKIILIPLAVYYINPMKGIKFTIISFILLLLAGVQMSCQELYYNTNNNVKNKSESLNVLNKFLCPAMPSNVKEYLKYTRYFGCGTANLIISLMIYYLNKL